MAWRKSANKPSRKRKPSLAALGPTPERFKHAAGGFEIGGDERSGRILRMRDAPIDRLRADHRLTFVQYEALARLARHWTLGGLAGSARSVNLDRVGGSGTSGRDGASETQIINAQAFQQAFDALERLERIVVSAVVLLEEPLVQAGTMLGFTSPYRARQAALGHLVAAADRLAQLWRIK